MLVETNKDKVSAAKRREAIEKCYYMGRGDLQISELRVMIEPPSASTVVQLLNKQSALD